MEKTIWSEKSQRLRKALADARKNAGFTQADLAKKLERPQSFVAKYEGGERRLDLVELMEICRILGVDPVRLVRELG